MARSFQPYNWLIVVGVFVLLLGGATALQAMSDHGETDSAASNMIPDQKFTTIDGKEISLHQFKGKTILVHYWGTWCPPCVEELPTLLSAVKNNPRVVVIAVTAEHNKTVVTNFLSRINNSDPGDNVFFVLDPSASIVIDKPVNRFPTTVIISPNLVISDRVNGGIDWGGYSF